MVIVIGMDNTGKTTLVSTLVKELGATTIKSPGPISASAQKEWVIEQLGLSVDAPVIYERFPLFEELVYGPILRDRSNFTYGDAYFRAVETKAPIIIYLRPSKEKIFNFEGREQYLGVIENAEKLLAAYDELYFKLICDGYRCLIYNYESQTGEALAAAIKLFQKLSI